MRTKSRATIADLAHTGPKAELVGGELLPMSPTGVNPKFAGDAILVALWNYAEETGSGRAVGDNAGFVIQLPGRQSFSPDAAFYRDPPDTMKFFEGAPVFAVEVRSEYDYGPAAEKEMAVKRHEYFQAGTLVVWDVNLISPDVVRVYRADAPDTPAIYRRGEMAEAEPAVPGWQMPGDRLFPRPVKPQAKE